MARRHLIPLLLLSLAGCATMPGDPAKMTAEQIREAVKDKSASVGCGAVQTPYKINLLYLVLDKATIPEGTLEIGADCTVKIITEKKAKP